jgi:hypothetical protein
MKKLLVILSSFSFIVPIAGTMTESFSSNVDSIKKVSYNTEANPIMDQYFSTSAGLGEKFTDIESIEIAGSTLGNYQGTLSVGFTGSKVYVIKSSPNGTVKDELFYDAGENIKFFTGRGTTLTIYGSEHIISIDCSSLGNEWLKKTINETWFDTETIKNNTTSKDYTEVFGTTATADNTFVAPETNKIVSGYETGGMQTTIYSISDSDGSIAPDKELKNKASYPGDGDVVTKIFNLFTIGDLYYAIGQTEKSNGKYKIWCLEDSSSSTTTNDIAITWDKNGEGTGKGTPINSNTGLPILLKVGKQLGVAYGKYLFFWNNENTGHSNDTSGGIQFAQDNEVFESNDGDITYATGATDPDENECILIGTTKGQFILRGISPNIGDTNITSESFNRLDKIGTLETEVSETVSPAITYDNAKIYVKSKDGSIDYFQRKIDLSKISEENANLTDKITDSTSLDDKITAIDTAMESGTSGSTMTPNDLVDIVGGTEKLDEFVPIPNSISSLPVKGNDNGVIIGEVTFKIGKDEAADALGEAIEALTYNLDKAFDADHGEILDKIKNIIDEQKYTDESSENYIQGLSSFTVNDYHSDKDFLQIGTDKTVILEVTVSTTSGTSNELYKYGVTLGGINKTALSISKDSGFSVDEDTSIKINNWSDILKYKVDHTDTDFDPATFKPEITGEVTADDTDNTNNTDSVTSFAVTADAADDWSQYVSVTLDNNTGVLDIKLLEHNPTAINMTVKIPGSAIFDEATITFTVPKWTPAPPIPWALIGGIIGGILGAALLGFLIFAFIKWWLPILMAKAPHSKGKTREYSRRPQQKADANAVRHTKKIQVRRATTHNDAGIVRSGIFEREIDVNQEKFKNPNRDEFLGYMMDEDVVVNNWNTGVDPDKRPRISYEKKTQVDNHNKEIAKKMADKKSQIIKNEKPKK